MLGELLQPEEPPKPARPRAVEATPKAKPKPSDVDESVIDSLLDQDDPDAGRG